MWARVAGAGVALVWLAGHQGAPGLGLGLAHALTLPLDPLANTACRLGLALKWGAVWVACHVVNAGDPCAGNHMAADAALIGMDVMAMAAIAGATAEPALCVVGVSRRLRTAAARQHAICVEGVRRLGQGRWLLLTIAATATEWFLVLDLVWARLFHALHPTNRPDTKEVMTLGDWSGQTPSGMAVLVHGLDSDASSLALLAQILVLNGVPVAMCDYHADPAKGYMHVAQDSVDVYASICMSQVADLVQQHAAQPRPAGAPLRLVFVGHSMGGLVACRMAHQLQSNARVEMAGVLTICSPMGGVPLLANLHQNYPSIAHFLKNVRTYARWDPRRIVGEFIRVEAWIWEEMAQRHARPLPDLPPSLNVVQAMAGQDVIVPPSAAAAGAGSVLHFAWASHYNLLLSRASCDRLARAALAILARAK
mmetsp:Transcript_103408/g.166697  ORF Transcript_103408/g.166697 Transcript_103408/m.166697 type:complete len:423 (-) Transcript_103408:102-1370(-)